MPDYFQYDFTKLHGLRDQVVHCSAKGCLNYGRKIRPAKVVIDRDLQVEHATPDDLTKPPRYTAGQFDKYHPDYTDNNQPPEPGCDVTT